MPIYHNIALTEEHEQFLKKWLNETKFKTLEDQRNKMEILLKIDGRKK